MRGCSRCFVCAAWMGLHSLYHLANKSRNRVAETTLLLQTEFSSDLYADFTSYPS